MSSARRTSILALLALASPAAADIYAINTAVNPANGHTYHLVAESPTGAERFSGVTWSQAEAYAQSQFNSHLATVNDAAENQWILSTFNNHYEIATQTGNSFHFQDGRQGIFIGYNDDVQEGQWQWVSGETPSFENWMPGEPNGAFPVDGTADYALLRPLEIGDPTSWGQWFDEHDVECFQTGGGYNPNYALIEVIPEPATLGLLIIGSLAMLRHKRKKGSN